MKAKDGVAAQLLAYIAAQRGREFTSLDAKRALPHLNWSSVRAHLHWMGRTHRLDVKRINGKKTRTYRDWPKEERVLRRRKTKGGGYALSFQIYQRG